MQKKSVVFPEVCKTPAPFTPTPYPTSEYEKSLRKANKTDAAAKSGNKQAQIEVKIAIANAKELCTRSGDEAPIVTSATQAVMIGWTLQPKFNGYRSRYGQQ